MSRRDSLSQPKKNQQFASKRPHRLLMGVNCLKSSHVNFLKTITYVEHQVSDAGIGRLRRPSMIQVATAQHNHVVSFGFTGHRDEAD